MWQRKYARGYRIEKAEELKGILEDAFASEKVCIIDCPVDYRENTKLTAHLKEVMTEYEHEKQ